MSELNVGRFDPIMSEPDSIRRNVRLKLAQGLHIRACSNVIAIVSGFAGKVLIHVGDRSADASSMFDLLLLTALPDSDLVIEASGDGAESIVEKLEDLFSKQTDPVE
ncbi:HPr family phosphocarrier protein [Thalassoglobus sp.]|uniref:HPr family phosphocarrier protein n=1 Tax=Thalassoglobus sp. TaxID=2795869 RepID=UPI003AA7F24B